jgi:decaprenylphospho-beta-D-erythro-pentofuranosid-2-ulose 2-reductase
MTRVMVLGGGSEIANAIVESLHRIGKASEVLLIGRNGKSMNRAYVSNCKIFGNSKCGLIDCNFSNPESTAETVRNAMNTFSPTISILAAGVNSLDPNSLENIQMGLINFVSMSIAGEEILKGNNGDSKSSIIVLSSIASIRPRPTNYFYGSTKVGLDFWARGAMARRPEKNEIILIRMGKVATASSLMHPWAPFTVGPDYIGSRTARLVGHGTRIVWIPRILRLLAMVLMMLPSSMWNKLSIHQSKSSPQQS